MGIQSALINLRMRQSAHVSTVRFYTIFICEFGLDFVYTTWIQQMLTNVRRSVACTHTCIGMLLIFGGYIGHNVTKCVVNLANNTDPILNKRSVQTVST